jgi:hypothetical protein
MEINLTSYELSLVSGRDWGEGQRCIQGYQQGKQDFDNRSTAKTTKMTISEYYRN